MNYLVDVWKLKCFVFQVLFDELKVFFGECCFIILVMCEYYGCDEFFYDFMLLDVVVFVYSIEEVVVFVKFCSQYDIFIIFYGVGILFEGYVLVLQGGVMVDLLQMNQVLVVNVEDLIVIVQVGVICKQLNQEIKDMGLFFFIDLGVDVLLGGMVLICVLGINVVCYGMMKENILMLIVVMVQGEIIKIGICVKKFLVGYDLICVYVGSEGIFGIIIEVIVWLYLQLEVILVVICFFFSVVDVVNIVIQIIQMGVLLVCVELFDENGVCVINVYDKLNLLVNLLLLFEFYGSDNGVKE